MLKVTLSEYDLYLLIELLFASLEILHVQRPKRDPQARLRRFRVRTLGTSAWSDNFQRNRERQFDDSGSICIKTFILNRNEYVRTGENDSNTDT